MPHHNERQRAHGDFADIPLRFLRRPSLPSNDDGNGIGAIVRPALAASALTALMAAKTPRNE